MFLHSKRSNGRFSFLLLRWRFFTLRGFGLRLIRLLNHREKRRFRRFHRGISIETLSENQIMFASTSLAMLAGKSSAVSLLSCEAPTSSASSLASCCSRRSR